MPTYRYKGKVPFSNLTYNLFNVQPGSVVSTKFLLPQNWTDFDLVDIAPIDGLARSDDYTVVDPVEIDISDYTKIVVRLKNSDQASVNIHLGYITADPIVLDNSVSYYAITLFTVDKLYLTAAAGQPLVTVYMLYEGSSVL